MTGMARAWLDLDVAIRAFTSGSAGALKAGPAAGPRIRALVAALADFHRAAAVLALADHDATAKQDFAAIVRIASHAGLSWQDMAEAVNRAAETNPRG